MSGAERRQQAEQLAAYHFIPADILRDPSMQAAAGPPNGSVTYYFKTPSSWHLT
jgi:hypothetical protein